MESIHIIIRDGFYIYEEYLVDAIGVNPIRNSVKRKKPKLYLQGIFVHYLMKELSESELFRNNFINNQKRLSNGRNNLHIVLQTTSIDLLDHNWNHRICEMVREKSEVDHILSWLSTLGGAYSALGDYFQECAEIAAKISMNQFKLALRIGDPQIAARCRLYLALSLIQRKLFRQAKKIIYREYRQAVSDIVIDIRLLRMCKGIWAKLQYEHFLHVQEKQKSQASSERNHSID